MSRKKNGIVATYEEQPTSYEKTCFQICLKAIKHTDSKFMIAPKSEKRYIENKPMDLFITIDEVGLINYNMNRYVASSKGTSLGGGFGGSGLLNEMQDKPGSFIIKPGENSNRGTGISVQTKLSDIKGIV
jgi:hypothetical protein